jgi:hypothetical protein
MNPRSLGKANFALVGAVLFSAFCWLCLYAAYADFAQAGFEAMKLGGLWHPVAGAALVGLHALGLLLVFVLAGGAAAALVRNPPDSRQDRQVNGSAH